MVILTIIVNCVEYFKLTTFPKQGFTEYDACCRRVCVPGKNLKNFLLRKKLCCLQFIYRLKPGSECGDGVYGCASDQDCQQGKQPSSSQSSILPLQSTGLMCNMVTKKCQDVDECTDPRNPHHCPSTSLIILYIPHFNNSTAIELHPFFFGYCHIAEANVLIIS